jgi:hypothetical protein
MFSGFKIRAEIAHVKIITKALDVYRSIIKGEITRVVPILEENKKTYQETKLEYPEFIDLRLNSLKSNLLNIEIECFNNRYLNILQLGQLGRDLADVKQRFIDTNLIIKKKKLNKIEINLSDNELLIINQACFLYWNILCGNLSILSEYTLQKYDKELLTQRLIELCDLATGFEDKTARLDVTSPSINRKAKWAYDICQSIDNIDKNDIIRNIGTLPRLKIIKNG